MKLGAESILSISSTNTFTYKVATHLEGPGQDFIAPGSRLFPPRQAGFSVL